MSSVTIEHLSAVRDQALSLATGLLGPAREEIAVGLVPGPELWDRLFLPDAAKVAAAAYARLYPTPPVPTPGPGQSDARIVTCPSELLGGENALAQEFPGGYARVAARLVPGVVWAAIRFVVPGQKRGMAYDGFACSVNPGESVPSRVPH